MIGVAPLDVLPDYRYGRQTLEQGMEKREEIIIRIQLMFSNANILSRDDRYP